MLGRWLVRLFAVFGALSLVLVLVVAGFVWWASGRFSDFAERTIEVPEQVVLTADWRGGVPEKADDFGPFGDFGFDQPMALPSVLTVLQRAVDDPRVVGLVVRIDGWGFGFAQAWELREAVMRLRDAGKFTAVYADTLGEIEGGMLGTYVAAAFDHVQLQPLGTVGFTGLSSEQAYFGRLLEELQIDFQVVQREAFKSALENLERSGPSPESTEVTNRLLDGLFDEFVRGVAAGRGLEEATVRAAVDRGPFLAEEAQSLGFIDAVDHQAALATVVEEASGTSERLSLQDYARSDAFAEREAAGVIGFVHAVGPIRRGENDDPFGELEIAGDSLAAAIDAAREAMVDALLIRVSSPGGSAVASETVAAAVRRVQADGIPVIVSMGDVAASGGYWISMDADRILAAPTTLTGSIGVIAGKPALAAFLEDWGIDVAVERRGANAGLSSVVDPWDERALERINVLIDDVYEAFIDGVAAGRSLDAARVRDVAGGRVWLGAEAIDLGLVDAPGGFLDGIEAARTAAEIDPDAVVRLQRFPEQVPPFAAALEQLERFIGVAAHLDAEWEALNAPASIRLETSPLPELR